MYGLESIVPRRGHNKHVLTEREMSSIGRLDRIPGYYFNGRKQSNPASYRKYSWLSIDGRTVVLPNGRHPRYRLEVGDHSTRLLAERAVVDHCAPPPQEHQLIERLHDRDGMSLV